MRRTFLLAALVAAASLGAQAQDIIGDWQGSLKVGPAELHLLLHISKTGNGDWKATMDSLDQGAMGIPVSTISLKDSKLTFTSDAVHGSYEGKVNPDASAIEGTWTQGQALPLNFTRAVKPSDIDGAWEGTLNVGQKLRLVLHLTTTKDGLTATLDSPDQGAAGIAASSARREGATLTVEIANIGAKYQATIAKDFSAIDGTFSQGGGSFPLALKRAAPPKPGDKPAEARRPQNPVKPYPYRAEDLKYPNPGAGIQLAATLTIPPGKGPFPAVVLITGSGQQDRDESLLGHKPFLVLSDYLTRKGIAVLRSDDRGAGGSGGDFAASTTADFATDVESAVAYLKTRPEVDPHRIGLAGHSEGGVIAPMVAARHRDIAFIVMMAGTGVPGDQIIVAQVVAGDEAAGMSHEAAAEAGVKQRRILDLVEHEKDEAVLKQKLSAELPSLPPAQFDSAYRQLTSPWYRYFLTYDPETALRKVACPVLAINGEKDTQVPPELNLPAIRKALQDGGNRHFEVDELPGLNHLFQHAKTGAVTEYAAIEETFAPEALEKIAAWIARQP
jgi:pimeloyl-ACP methyl ester carboxylesterase